LEEVITHAEEMKGKAGDSLRERLADVIRSRRINALVCDLTLPVQPSDLQMQPWDREEVHKIFDGLEFRVLRDRLFQTLTADEPQVDAAAEVQTARLAPDGLADWLGQPAPCGDPTGVYVHGHLGRGPGQVATGGVATGA